MELDCISLTLIVIFCQMTCCSSTHKQEKKRLVCNQSFRKGGEGVGMEGRARSALAAVHKME